MLIREKGDQTVELHVSLNQMKTLYVALFRRLHDLSTVEFDELDEDDMLTTLQLYLQRRAAAAGVDCTNHAAWETFLGVKDAPSCEDRFADRKSVGDDERG